MFGIFHENNSASFAAGAFGLGPKLSSRHGEYWISLKNEKASGRIFSCFMLLQTNCIKIIVHVLKFAKQHRRINVHYTK